MAIVGKRSPQTLLPPGQAPIEHATERDMRDVVVGSYDGVYANSLRYPQFSLDQLQAKQGQQFIEDMLNLAGCRAPFNLKRYAVLKDGWEITPAVTDPFSADMEAAQELADATTYALSNILDTETDTMQDFRSLVFDMMFGGWGGFRVGEIVYQYQEDGELSGMHGFSGIYTKPNKQIGFDADPRTMAVRNLTSYTPSGGYDFSVPVAKCVYYVANQSANSPAGMGDWHPCYPHWFRLNAELKFWATSLERWGAVALLLKYPAGDAAALAAAVKAGDRIRGGATAAIPDNVDALPLTAPQGVFDALKEAADWDTRQIASLVLGNTLSTGEGEHGATSAGSDVHQDSGEIVYDALSGDMCSVFSKQLIRRFIRDNYGQKALKLCPTLRLRKRGEGDKLKLAQMLKILIDGKNMPSRSKVVREELGLPPIDQDEEKLLDAEKQAADEAAQQLADSRNSGTIAKMSSHEAKRAIDVLTKVIFDRDTLLEAK